MATQIRLAQAPEDEAEMLEWLQEKGRFLALPSFFQAREPVPVELGRCQASDLIFFPESASERLLGSVKPATGSDDTFLVDLGERAGLVIEWSRTPPPVKKTIELGGASLCRLLYEPAPAPRGASAELARIASQLFAHVRRSSAAKSSDKKPFHVGPHLLARVQSGQVRLIYPNGDPIELTTIK
jgi:hypothetical protein